MYLIPCIYPLDVLSRLNYSIYREFHSFIFFNYELAHRLIYSNYEIVDSTTFPVSTVFFDPK
jgi:hypothetical protein